MKDLVLEYYIVSGNKRAAEAFAVESGCTDCQRLEHIDIRVRINELISAGVISEAIEMVQHLNEGILSDNTKLHFELRVQELIEMLRNKESSFRALEFARSHLLPFSNINEDYAADIQKCMSLLLFAPSNSYPETLWEYFDVDRRRNLAVEVNKAVLKSLSYGTESRLHHLLRVLVQKQQDIGSKMPQYIPVMGLSEREES